MRHQLTYQLLIYQYQLDFSKLPVAIVTAAMEYARLYRDLMHTPEAKPMLAALDDKLSVSIVQFIRQNQHQLEAIVCDHCQYQLFYHRLFHVALGDTIRMSGTDQINGYKITYFNTLAGFKNDDFYRCDYDEKNLIAFRVNHDLQICEPLYWAALVNNKNKSVYKYEWYSEDKNYDPAREQEINTFADQVTEEIATNPTKWKFYPALEPHINKMKIELN